MSFSPDIDLADFLLSLQDPFLDFDQEPFKNDIKDDYNPLGISDDFIESLFETGSPDSILGLKDECKIEVPSPQPEVVDYAEEIIDCDTSSDGNTDDVMEPIMYTEGIEEGIILQSDPLDLKNAMFLSDDSKEYSFEYDCTSTQPVLIAYSASNELKILNKGDILQESVEDLNLSDAKDDLTSNDDQTSEYSYDENPKLHLTDEEKKLAEKEGIVLPTRLPLTKLEERELKRIRRKIRNKISAQDSRRRKKEYVDGLEERVKLYSEENAHLLKRIKLLEKQNVSLSAQVKKLQDTIAKSSTTQTTQNSTCFLVLIMSLALVLAPSLRNSLSDTESAEDEGICIPDENAVTGQARTLLYAHKHSVEDTCDLEEESKVLSEKLDQIGFSKKDMVGKVMEMLRYKMKSYDDTLKDHDYLRSRKRPRPFDGDMTSDGLPPFKIPPSKLKQAMKMIGLLANKNRKQERFKAARSKSVVIDLSSDEME